MFQRIALSKSLPPRHTQSGPLPVTPTGSDRGSFPSGTVLPGVAIAVPSRVGARRPPVRPPARSRRRRCAVHHQRSLQARS
eukprot:364823-Chlamydomonas_euryale.AAC.2